MLVLPGRIRIQDAVRAAVGLRLGRSHYACEMLRSLGPPQKPADHIDRRLARFTRRDEQRFESRYVEDPLPPRD
jgi:hypothetical protein